MNNQYAPPQSDVAGVNRAGASGITDAMLEAMRGTKPWVLLIGIVLIISAVFMLLATLGIIGASAIGAGAMGEQTGMMIGVGSMYAVMSIIYIMMGVYLFKYSSSIGRLLQSASVVDMEDALHSQRKFWKIAGVITAIMLVLMVLGIIAAIAIPILTMVK
jgi:hypothetical protein